MLAVVPHGGWNIPMKMNSHSQAYTVPFAREDTGINPKILGCPLLNQHTLKKMLYVSARDPILSVMS